jgi:hypothetical protein
VNREAVEGAAEIVAEIGGAQVAESGVFRDGAEDDGVEVAAETFLQGGGRDGAGFGSGPLADLARHIEGRQAGEFVRRLTGQ